MNAYRSLGDCERYAAKDSSAINDIDEIREVFTCLIGLRLAAAHRALDMRMFHFGAMRPATPSRLPSLKDRPPGLVGRYALHVQCPWRLEAEDEIITGRFDLWEPITHSDDVTCGEWNYEKDGNLQDFRVAELLESTDMVVQAVDVKSNGHFELHFDQRLLLSLFPSGSLGEDWRFFEPNTDKPHFVVSGGKIEHNE